MPFFDRVTQVLRAVLGRRRRLEPIRDGAALREFLQTRASFVAQMTLYGYLRTRAGVRFPELFEDDRFVASVNIAKWHVWLACLSDLAAYAGGMLRRQGAATDGQVGEVMVELVEEILRETGTPPDAGPEFGEHAGRVLARLRLCDWSAQSDDEGPFSESPSALVYWAPVVEDLKALDEEIVRNSIRFRWQEIRQQFRRALDAPTVIAAVQHPPSPPAGS